MADTDIVFASFATDGIDGKSDAAGAVADGFSLIRAHKKDLNPAEFLKDNDSYEFFNKLDDLLMTGPTGTNVMDIQIIVC
jgi:glycerate-2-kinase